jgi:hypothetical protein
LNPFEGILRMLFLPEHLVGGLFQSWFKRNSISWDFNRVLWCISPRPHPKLWGFSFGTTELTTFQWGIRPINP